MFDGEFDISYLHHKQFITGLRSEAPPPNVRVFDQSGRLLRIESPTGQPLTIFKQRRSKRNGNLKPNGLK